MACSCAEKPASLKRLVKRAKKEASHVFQGVATQALSENGVLLIIFRVEQFWKPGSLPDDVEVRTSAFGEACGYRFEVGRRYLVYARTEEGVIRTDICTRTKPAESARDELLILGTGDARKPPRA
jgi:hypothetical protein